MTPPPLTEHAEMPAHVAAWLAENVFDEVPSNVLVIDRDLRVVVANHTFRRNFGQVEGKYCYEAYKRAEQPCAGCQAQHTFGDGQVRISDESGIDCNGRPTHYVVRLLPLRDAQGGITHIVEMSYDVTEARFLRRENDLLFERVPCYVSVIDRDFRVVRANDLVKRTFGEAEGAHCYRLYKRREQPCEDCPAVRTLADGKSYTTRHIGTDRQGCRTCYVMSTIAVSPEGQPGEHVIEMAVDVTATEALSAELAREGQLRHHLTESAIDALVAVDTAGVVSLFNHAAENLFGVRARDVIGQRRGHEFLPPGFVQLVAEGGRNLLLPETQVQATAGEAIPVRFSGTVLRAGDTVIGGAAFLQDLRNLKQLEREKLENERLAAVGQTVAQLAHGVKNTLMGIQGGMYTLRSGLRHQSSERWEKGWGMLERNVGRITELVMGFLSFSKGHIPQVESADPATVAENVFQLYREAARKRGVRLRLEVERSLRPAPLDLESLHTCLENLVSNAMDACQVAETAEPEVSLRVTEREGTIRYEVADNGCGMDYEVKQKVFTTFYTTKGAGGTGLGLLVTRKLVHEHGGKLEVESEPGQGSVFTIELPRCRLPQPQASAGLVSEGVTEGAADGNA